MTTPDVRAAAARSHHRAAADAEREADVQRASRDRLIKQLRAEDPRHWTYKRISQLLGCSPELAAHIVKH